MAATIASSPTPECCTTCTAPTDVNVPGVAGSNGAAGSAGTNGLNAFSSIVGGATLVPAFGASETVELAAPAGSLWIGQSQTLYVQSYGYFRVDAIPDPTHVTLFNLGYAGNVDGNGIITFADGTRVQPGGVAGSAGSGGAGAFLVANNLSEGDLATKQSNLGIGTAGTRADNFFFQVANNLNEGVPATMRASLLLLSAALKDAGVTNGKLPPIDTTFTNGDSVWATASGLQTKTAANAKLALGLGGGLVGNYILCQDIHASNSVPPAFNNAVPVQVPINTKKADTGGIATLVGNVLTLPVGTYRVRASVPGFQCGLFQALLWNTFNNVLEFMGSVGSSDALSATTGWSFVNGLLVVAGSSKTYELRAQCVTPGSFGAQCAFGDEVYASLELEQQS